MRFYVLYSLIVIATLTISPAVLADSSVHPVVEVEETVYEFDNANNGSGPTWCHGNTCIVRLNNTVVASGIEVLPEVEPLNNVTTLLFKRTANGWKQVYRDDERTREPSPVGLFPNGEILLSVNPTLTEPDAYNGPADPQILVFKQNDLSHVAKALHPQWDGEPRFTEHSYRTFVTDAARRECFLLQNIGYAHAEWAFYNHEDGEWPAQGQLEWPYGHDYDEPKPIRLCYPAVRLKNRALHFLGVSDIVEPNQAWREYKKKITGRDWDYDFRRLFYTWTEDITQEPFHDWVEVSSREETCGWIYPMDIHVGEGGEVLALWNERALDERLREEFFPDAKQRYSLELALLKKGEIIWRQALVEGGEGLGNKRPGDGRFHITPDGRLWVIYYLSGTDAEGERFEENRLVEIQWDGTIYPEISLNMQKPLSRFFNNTVRAGCSPSPYIDLFGSQGNTMRYARIHLKKPKG